MSIKNTLTALVAGMAVGAAAGLVLAPASGDETRKKLLKRGDKLYAQLSDLIGKGKDAVDDAEKSAKSAANKAGRAVNDTMDKAKDTYEKAKGAV
ncbi:MAG: YtxH domain-containing protein [Flavobacteriales bacterium]